MSEINLKELNLDLKEGHAVCFDFDGVIHLYRNGWKDGSIYDWVRYDVLEFMMILRLKKIPVFICSTRNPEQIIKFLKEEVGDMYGKFIKIDENIQFWNDLDSIGVTNKKLPAQLYIDDRAYNYNGQSLEELLNDFSKK